MNTMICGKECHDPPATTLIDPEVEAKNRCYW